MTDVARRVRSVLDRPRGRGRSPIKPAETAFFRDILAGVVREQRPVDLKIDAALADGWPLKRIEAMLRAILRAGAYELHVP